MNVSQADPLIGQHAIHWVMCGEAYAPSKRQNIDQWELLDYATDYCTYVNEDDQCIVAYKGTTNTRDLLQDALITKFNVPSRGFTSIPYVKELLETYSVQVTGHSLGGAVARVVASSLGLGVVTFNEAAPPTAYVTNPSNSASYHIVWDIISAWQQPTLRIDKNFRGTSVNSVKSWSTAHSLSSFSNERMGRPVGADFENHLFQDWWKRLSLATKISLKLFVIKELPEIK